MSQKSALIIGAASLGISEEEVVRNIMLHDTVDGVLTGQTIRLTHGRAMM